MQDDLMEEEEGPYDRYPNSLPPSLIKSFVDHPWEYALGLRNGQVIEFQGAKLLPGGEWIHIPGPDDHYDLEVSGSDYSFARGIDVRVSDIVWVCDAPHGS